MSLDLSIPIRSAIVANSAVTANLPAYLGSYPVFTRRPVPGNAPYPMIVISDDISLTDQDGVNDFQPIAVRDIGVYGRNNILGQMEVVLAMAYLLRTQFHRKRLSLTVPGWNVTDIVVTGPTEIPMEDQIVGRNVELTVRLNALTD